MYITIEVNYCGECPYFLNSPDDAKLCERMVEFGNGNCIYDWIIDNDRTIPIWCPFKEENNYE